MIKKEPVLPQNIYSTHHTHTHTTLLLYWPKYVDRAIKASSLTLHNTLKKPAYNNNNNNNNGIQQAGCLDVV